MNKFEPISKHISRLELPWRFFGVLNFPVSVWLIRTGDSFTLIDTGHPEATNRLIPALHDATQGRGPQRVLLTHAHIDHAGGLNALNLAWKPEVICHRDAAPLVRGEISYRQLKTKNLAFRLGRLLMPLPGWDVKISGVLEGGQSVAGLVVIHLPGHSPGHIGFLHPQDMVMICGDAVMNYRGRLSPPSPYFTQDPDVARASIQRLADLDCRMLLPSHGLPITTDVRARLQNFLGDQKRSSSDPEW
ncbi:MAG: MBL fold metallo-hydrolase [Anaerolineales bacterium]|jgi:glyoxylase-like metal-dependent hydrolase (beta-lactamase superfamily II)